MAIFVLMKHNLIPNLSSSDVIRFWSKVARGLPTECWWWHGWVDSNGYARFDVAGKSYKASRIAHFLLNGVDLGGRLACHECDEPECVNPFHVWAGTNADNCRDMALKGRATRGERNPQAKLTQEKANTIRSSTKSGRELAAEHGVSEATISMIRNGKIWRE